MAKAFDRPALSDALRKGAAALPVTLSDTQFERLLDYLALLAKWNAVYNLTAVRDPAQMVVQHLLDSLAAVPAFVSATRVLDVGSGGGLPGMVLAIWAQEARPDMRIAMIDTVSKKTAFLTQVKAELGLSNVTVHTGRVEALQVGQPFDVITSRAFADLSDFVNWSGHLLAEGGRFIAMKGIAGSDETGRLPAEWRVLEKTPLAVPGLDAERHLVVIARAGE
ncbi:16S rRNA (guanine(527)-N(7))-methyltransferase RsmG [Noviherbaspirillum suwonense]|jgi:16S rRNA (guanine527-N7)-methyltransferase|uniref:Ribosomal RNA small subunit methyltransferase G n=1 Tax=Noviherbaspirillum suwonense TaxID=1224511 RepID=A0ABY1QBN9_9BURK|nr:16S rRNA (guanine(527)-N(7))-methyltransferase RsmG [Noviherbaspirillum suwonense]SMP64723.1 16S rRNA m(7)G-527 methyltransferase [Noviherbaspirillum suwonense]